MRRTTTRSNRRPLAILAAATMTIGALGAPATTAQPSESVIPGSSFDFVVGTADAPGDPAPSDPVDDAYLAELTEATNAAREANGRAPLRHNADLSRVASEWSGVQADENRMYHNPDVRAQLPEGWRHYGENVLQNWDGATPEGLVDQWMDSPPHRANLLRADHTDLGVGVAVADDGRLYSTQLFARF